MSIFVTMIRKLIKLSPAWAMNHRKKMFRILKINTAFVCQKISGNSPCHLFMEVREELWPRAKAYDVAPFWTFCRGIKVFGIANGIPDFLDIRIKTKELHALGFEDYIPFLSIIGDGDVIFCFDKDNHIVALDWYNSGETEELECDFSGLLLQQIAELEERKNEMVNLLEKGKSSQ